MWNTRFASVLLPAVLFISACSEKSGTKDPAADDYEFPSAAVMNQLLGKGVNFGNALDAPSEGEWGVTLKSDYFRWVADSGFQTVRLPVRWSAHADSVEPYAIDPSFLARVDWAVDQAVANGLNIIIDMHHYEAMMTTPGRQTPRFLALWKQLAEHYADRPPSVLFELLNEPRDSLSAEKWNTILVQALAVVRKSNPYRTVIIGTSPWGGIDGLSGLELPADSQLIATVHYYEPHSFTHQGSEFEDGADAWLGTTWRATPPQRNAIHNALAAVSAWSHSTGVPVMLGEFGTYYKADTMSRAFWTEYIATQATQAGLSWAYWNFSSDFGLLVDSTDKWHHYLTQALLHPGANALLQDALLDSTGLVTDTGVSVLVEDFEDSVGQLTRTGALWMTARGLPRDSAQGGWFPYFSDSSILLSGGGDTVLLWSEARAQDRMDDNIMQLIGECNGGTGRCLHARGLLRGSDYPFLGFEVDFTGWDDAGAMKDLSDLQAISFRAKGHGEWWLDIVTDTVLNGYDSDNNWGNFGTSVVLDSTWKDYVIPVSYLQPKPWSQSEADGLVWADGMRKANAINFMNGQSYGESPDDTLEIWLDDLRLIGVDSATILAYP